MNRWPHDNRWPRDGNIGDCIQTLGVENIYKKMKIDCEKLLLVNRDDIKTYDKEDCILPMQSWFGNYANVFPLPWSDKITPIFIGFHLNKMNNTRQKFLDEKIHLKMKPFEPIGCRDRNTRDFLIANGVEAYFSGCMTLTFNKREKEPKNGKIFLVDLTKRTIKKLPQEIKDNADMSITHFYYWNEYPVSWKGAEEFEQEARNILERYKNEAKLVITSKIHVAMPCVAIGIPVVFIHEDYTNERFDVLKGILPIYSPNDMKFINFDTKPVDISKLKSAIIENAIARIKQSKDLSTIERLNEITINMKPIKYGPLWLKLKHYLTKR